MFGWLTPARRRGVEILDDPETPDELRTAAMADVERSNAWFGGARAVRRAVEPLLDDMGEVTLLDVGTGRGDVPALIARNAARRGTRITTIGLDVSETLARTASVRMTAAVVGNAIRLPFRSSSVDVVVSSQVLHHFFEGELRALVAELDRVARSWVVVADLERSVLGAAAFWVASFVLRFHWATRLDGVTSVLRGFTPAELESLVRDVTGKTPRLRRGLFCRVTATWRAR